MTITEGWTSPEGFWLYRPVLLPDARSFDDVLEYEGEWDYGNREVPFVAQIHGNEISPYCSIRTGSGGYRGIKVRPRPGFYALVQDRIVTDSDRLSFEVVVHPERERALVILEHGHIIGSHWLAYVDAATIPAKPED
jgi:hypothetical protein